MSWFIGISALFVIAGLVFVVWAIRAQWGLGKMSKNMLMLMGTVFVLSSFGTGSAVHALGSMIDRNNTTSFHEYWNGFEVSATYAEIKCERDGICVQHYDCDAYTVMVPMTIMVPDGNGGMRSQTTMRSETRYHKCPYSTQETRYTVSTTLGDFTIAEGVLTGGKFRPNKNFPAHAQTEAPSQWVDAKKRIDAGEPRGVTQVNKYENYLLASQEDLYERYEGEVESLKEQNLLPAPAEGVHGHYMAEKFYKVGDVRPSVDYNTHVANINGALGVDKKQGDLHVVMVDDSMSMSPDNYSNALMAYWNSKELGRNAIAKNSIVVVMGANSAENTVSWARAFTGMPVGNEGMTQQIQSELPGLPLDDALLGNPVFTPHTNTVAHSEGALETILWGKNAFERVSMSGDEEGDVGSGFAYLKDSIQVSTMGYVMMTIVSALVISGLAVLTFFGTAKILEIRTPTTRTYY